MRKYVHIHQLRNNKGLKFINTRNNNSVHQVIDVARKNAVKGFGKHQFSVDVPQGPKYNANKLTNWKC